MPRPIRVLLVDDHPLIRAGVYSVLEEEGDIEIVGEANSTVGLEAKCAQLQPDVVLLDLRIPGPPPAEVIERLQAHHPDVHIIVLTAYDEEAYIRLAVGARISGYILKDEMPDSIVKAIRTVMEGGVWYSRAIANKLSRLIRQPHRLPEPVLTPREKEVLRLIAQGYSNTEIAEALNLAYQTVRNYISRIYSKLGVHSRSEVIMLARQYEETHGQQEHNTGRM
ncbi:MAG: response regulator transcription factor [Ardenticatenia bacterium]|nr:response regulator transcription factor [Ardenticatenia bacterium]